MSETPNASAAHPSTATAPISGERASIANRYAGALFDLATDQSAIDATEKDVRTLLSLVTQNQDLAAFLKSPLYDRDAQKGAIGEIVRKAGLSPLIQNFTGLVARNRRLFVLPDILRAFLALTARHRGEVTAEATTATALSADQERRLRAEIETLVGKAVTLNTNVDPALLGGMIVKVGSRMIDSSLRTKLNRLQTVMKEA